MPSNRTTLNPNPPLPLWCLHTQGTLPDADIIAIIGTSDQSCWPAEACKFLLQGGHHAGSDAVAHIPQRVASIPH